MHDKISSIEIENFKLFKKLKIKDFKMVNLIGGKNNIGKTALLEAINLNVSAIDFNILISNIKNMLYRRHNMIELDIFLQDTNELRLITDKRNIAISYENKLPETIIYLELNKVKQGIPLGHILNGTLMLNQYKFNNVNFIPSGYVDTTMLSELYGYLVSIGKDDIIDNSLRLFDDNIISVRQVIQGKAMFKVKLKHLNQPISLTSLGEGINRFMAIICAIWASKDGYLFIDKIENGIHYTNYEKLWGIIFQISEEANCQVFITTHSKECIESFNQINTADDGSYIELYRNKKTGNIISKTRNHEVLQYSLTHNGRFRGE